MLAFNCKYTQLRNLSFCVLFGIFCLCFVTGRRYAKEKGFFLIGMGCKEATALDATLFRLCLDHEWDWKDLRE